MENGRFSGEIYDVFVFPYSESTVSILRAAKAQMGVDYQIVAKESQWGARRRMVAFQYVPWVVTDGIAYVNGNTTPQAVGAAIHWAATGDFDSRVSTVEQQLSKIFGKPVTEISKDQLAFENASKALDLGNAKKVRFGK